MLSLQGTAVLILGLGASGLSMARWCAREGARVTVLDTRAEPPGLDKLKAQCPLVRFEHVGSFTRSQIEGMPFRAVCRSPGLLPSQVAEVAEYAQSIGLPVWGELDLFLRALETLRVERGYLPKVLAITGTNGKTTVTSLTGQLVARAGKSVCVAGNIGPTLLDTLTTCLEAKDLPEVWTLELSSFQLDTVQGFMPTMGTVLNLTQDHLDWHGDMRAYASAKARIFGEHRADAPPMLLNRDDPLVLAMRPTSFKGRAQRGEVTFGSDLPTRPGDYGLETVNGMTWLVRAMEADETIKRRKGEDPEVHIQRLMPADALRIRGRHNALNALAALALASAAGCSLPQVLYGLREYRGEPHRVESVGVINGVEYFDDGKGTNVGATVAALTGLGSEAKVVLILGGVGKGQDFSPLAAPVSRYAKAIILIGRDAPLIQVALQSCGVSIQAADSMNEATRLAAECAQAGDAVLLSPACASFDMFNDYVHRSQVFVDCVRQLAQEAGTSAGQFA